MNGYFASALNALVVVIIGMIIVWLTPPGRRPSK